jgi:hypothetical protein
MDRPETLADLAEALTSLPSLGPVERARRCPPLIEAAKAVLSHEYSAAMAEAVDGKGYGARADLARQLEISEATVSNRIKRLR